MYITEVNNIPTILASLDKLHTRKDELLVLFIGEENPPDIEALIQAINSHHITMIGGIFPGIIANGEVKKSGIAAQTFPMYAKPYRFPDHSLLSIDQYVTNEFKALSFSEDRKPVALVLSSNLSLTPYAASCFCEALGDALRSRVTYVGGAAGETILRPGAYIFDNNGVYCDGTFLALLDTKMSVKYGYGWTTVSNPYIVTKCCENVVLELNGRPALKVFQDQYRTLTGKTITPDEINVTKEVHVGIIAGRREKIMRGIIGTTPEGGLILAGGVSEKAVLTFMKSTQNVMDRNSVGLARTLARDVQTPRSTLVIECLTRHILSEDQLSSELRRIQTELKTDNMVGFLAWGEVVQLQEGAVEFLNESVVIAVEHN